MHLRLSLPAHTDVPQADIETRPSEFERWLKGLPLLNVTESTQLLTHQLAALNRSAIDDKLRLRLLELLRAPIQHVSQALLKSTSVCRCHFPRRRARLPPRCVCFKPKWV